MGFNGWRNLSVLLLTGAALVGCNNTPQKDKTIIGAGPKAGDPPVRLDQANKGAWPNAGVPVGSAASDRPFPTTTNPNVSPLPTTLGQVQPAFNSSVQPSGGPGGQPPIFPPMNDFARPTGLNNQAPALPKAPFGEGRISQPQTPPSDPSNGLNIPRPDSFK